MKMGMSKNQLKRAEAEMKKTRLIFAKNASVIKQSKSLARKIASLSPPNMAVAIFSFFVMAASGVHKKGLRNMLESQYPTDVWKNVEPLLSEMEVFVEELEFPLETLVEQLVEEIEIETPQNLTVSILNESAKVGKAKPTVKEVKLQRFFSFLKIFEERLKNFGVVTDEEIAKFLEKMTSAVHKISIKGRKEVKKV
jgi:hypothetical protein